MRKAVLFFLFIWLFLILMVSIMFVDTSHTSAINAILSTLNFSLRFLGTGFDISSTMNFDKNMLLYSIYPFITYFLVSVPLKSMLIGILLAHL